MNQIDELLREETKLLKSIEENRTKQRKYYTDFFIEKNKIEIGNTVTINEYNKTYTGVIDRFRYQGTKVSGIHVKLFNSNGKLGKRDKFLFSFELSKIIDVVKT